MPTLRVHRGDSLIVELDLAGDHLEVGDRPGDGVRLDELGVLGVAGGGGAFTRLPSGWVFAPRAAPGAPDAGPPTPVPSGRRIAVGDALLELVQEAPGARVDLGSLPAQVAGEGPLSALVARPGSAAARLLALADVLDRLDASGPAGDGLLERALDAAFALVGAEHGLVARTLGDGASLRVVASRGLPADDPRKALSRRVLETVLAEGRDVVAGDAPAEIPTVSISLARIRALCALPLRVRGRVAGVLYVDRGRVPLPFTPEDLAYLRLLASLAARRLEEQERADEAERRTQALQASLARRATGGADPVGWTSPAMRRLQGEAERLLKAFQGRGLPVLLTGESGTGKEVLARWLHERVDERVRGPFVALNCAAIPHDLAESELFGIEQGVASGVLKRVGRLQQAHGGTLFLDEVGEMALPVQAKLLRALETRRILRVGGRDEIPIEVRLISATNAALREAVRAGRFREDLYWRLTGVELHLPPLRERREDIPALAAAFAQQFAEAFGVEPPRLLPSALDRLGAWPWPGNVRELRQRMGALTALHPGAAVGADDLPPELGAGASSVPAAPAAVPPATVPPAFSPAAADPRPAATAPADEALTLAEVERRHIERVLASVGGDRGRAAEILGIHRKTLLRRLSSPDA